MLYYTSDGKPDKRRRPGRPWEASVFAGGDKATYSGGSGVNLMAHIQKEKLARAGGSEFKTGSIKSVEQTLQQVSLQTYLEEVNLYEQLLNPIAQIMEKNMGINPMGLSALAQNGWGAEGAKMVPALQDIGAISPPPPAKGSLSRASSAKTPTFLSVSPSSKRRVGGSAAVSAKDQSKIALFNNSRQVNMSGSAPTPSQRQVTWKEEPSLSSNSSTSTSTKMGFDGEDKDDIKPIASVVQTPMDVLRAVKARKKAARKSLLPALDAHTYLYDHQRPAEQTQYIGDLKTLDRLFVKQAHDADLRHVRADRKLTAQVALSSSAGAAGAVSGSSAGTVGGKLLVRSNSTAAPSALETTTQLPARNNQLMPMGVSMAQLIGSERSDRSTGRRAGLVVSKPAGSLADVVEMEMFWNDVHKAGRERVEAENREIYEKRRAHKKAQVRSSKIPWELMDSLDGAKTRFENEKLYHEFNHKY